MTKVVSMDGSSHPSENEPDPDVIACLERALEEARSGELGAVAIGKQYADSSCGWNWAGNLISPSLIGVLTVMSHEISGQMLK
jgi:hypothetical protein